MGDVRLSLSDYTARRRTAGLLILKDGEIALERYGTSSGPERRRQSYSIAKSITSTLVGAALHDGAIGSLDDRCDLYLTAAARLGLHREGKPDQILESPDVPEGPRIHPLGPRHSAVYFLRSSGLRQFIGVKLTELTSPRRGVILTRLSL